MPGGRPRKFDSVEELEKAIEAYFEETEIREKPYTMSGLAYYLDMNRQTLLNYSKEEVYFGTIKRARDRVELWWEENLQGNSVAGTIFNLKNNFGWKDKVEQEHTVDSKDQTHRIEIVMDKNE